MGDTPFVSPKGTGFRPRLKLALVSPSENEFAESVKRHLETVVLEPAEWTCFPAGIVPLPKAHATKLSRFGLKRGWPDYLILHERLYGLELKAHGGRLSKGYWARSARGAPIWREGQEEVFPRLTRAGMTIAVCWSLADVDAALAAWDIPRRRTR